MHAQTNVPQNRCLRSIDRDLRVLTTKLRDRSIADSERDCDETGQK